MTNIPEQKIIKVCTLRRCGHSQPINDCLNTISVPKCPLMHFSSILTPQLCGGDWAENDLKACAYRKLKRIYITTDEDYQVAK